MAGGWSQGLKVTIWKTVLLLEAFWLKKQKRLLLDRGLARLGRVNNEVVVLNLLCSKWMVPYHYGILLTIRILCQL